MDTTSAHQRGIYIASKTVHAPRWRKLRAAGFPIISTWIDEAGVGESKCLKDLWRRCITEAAGAAALVLYHEPGEMLKGAWVEAGAALTRDVPVFGVGVAGYSVANHQRVTLCETVEEAFRQAQEVAPTPPAPRAIDGLVERICHEEQMQIWSHEIAVRLSMGDYLRDGLTYEDKIHIHREVEVEIRSIVESVVSNPEVRAALAATREGPAATGERREASFDPATGRCFGEGEGEGHGAV
ncbi:hypothetical protein [uncultured Methylobacterium sp.]|mgnify:CR=1 FL=1|uniref:hypothetical protein n=1 Tax=uncultured Methylobacterium sp. TaxID=157278 RepID=UPI0026161074|nr:hypothetical protein [uncultured Methylobacterium sp.]